jgi:hypothetical protein
VLTTDPDGQVKRSDFLRGPDGQRRLAARRRPAVCQAGVSRQAASAKIAGSSEGFWTVGFVFILTDDVELTPLVVRDCLTTRISTDGIFGNDS